MPRDLPKVPPHDTRTQVQSDVLQESDSVDNDEENIELILYMNINESPGMICTDLIADRDLSHILLCGMEKG